MDLLKPGDRVSASAINEGVKANAQLKTIKVGSGMVAKNFPGGIFLDAVQSPFKPSIYITSNTGTAQYQGTLQQGSVTTFPTTGVTNTGATVLVYNLPEVGSSASQPFLSNGSVVLADLKGTDSATGLPVYWCEAFSGAVWTCTSAGTSSSSSGG